MVSLSFVGYAWSQNTNNHKPVAPKNQQAEQPKGNPSFDTSSLEKTIREAVKEATEKPDPHADEKAKADRQLVEYTGELAAFTKWLVAATILLAAIAIWQGVQLMRTVDLGREEFIAAHRPRIILRDSTTEQFMGELIVVEYILSNVGDAPATIVSSAIRVNVFQG